MANNPSVNISSLFSELNKLGQNGEYFRALKIANKILQEVPNDSTAQHCKIVCLIQESRFQDALSIIEKNKSDDLNLSFEKAYCLYRLNRITKALAILNSINDPAERGYELKAQILYRLEQYDKCFDTYKEIIKYADLEYEVERETNIAAVIASLAKEKDQIKNLPKLSGNTYELCYNAACMLLNQGKVIEAIAKLRETEELCRLSLEEDDAEENEIEAELALVRVQLAYASQLLNKNEEALSIYNQVLKQRPSDIALIAVASNNIVSINKDQNVFDSKKRIRQATVDGLEHKLTSEQQFRVAVNQCLLSFNTNQYDACKHQVKKLQEKYPGCVEPLLVLAAVLCKEKQTRKAVEILKGHSQKYPEASVEINLILSQLLISQGKVKESCEILSSMGDASYKLGVVSTLVALYQRQEDTKLASKLLKQAVEWHQKNKTDFNALTDLLQASSQFHLKNGDPQTAAKCLEELRKAKKDDMKILAKLISAYSQFDAKKSEEISRQLPHIETAASTVDVESLEASHWSLGAKYVKKTIKAEPSPASAGKKSDGLLQRIKKKKKKKTKMPKNYDASVDPDPERWLPRKERSTYRRKKDKKGQNVGKGTQGMAAGASDYLDASKNPQIGMTASPSASSPQSAGPQGPRQQRPQASQKKRRKKGGKW